MFRHILFRAWLHVTKSVSPAYSANTRKCGPGNWKNLWHMEFQESIFIQGGLKCGSHFFPERLSSRIVIRRRVPNQRHCLRSLCNSLIRKDQHVLWDDELRFWGTYCWTNNHEWIQWFSHSVVTQWLDWPPHVMMDSVPWLTGGNQLAKWLFIHNDIMSFLVPQMSSY